MGVHGGTLYYPALSACDLHEYTNLMLLGCACPTVGRVPWAAGTATISTNIVAFWHLHLPSLPSHLWTPTLHWERTSEGILSFLLSVHTPGISSCQKSSICRDDCKDLGGMNSTNSVAFETSLGRQPGGEEKAGATHKKDLVYCIPNYTSRIARQKAILEAMLHLMLGITCAFAFWTVP